jgi:two-component system, NarL family, response regulator LiaR
MDTLIRVLIVDDHAIVREGLRALISTSPGLAMAGEAADGVEGVEKALALKPDVILMDLVMPRMDGPEAIRQIRQAQSTARILVLTSFSDDSRALPALKAGVQGYLLKNTPAEQIVQAIHDVAQDRVVLDPIIARRVMHQLDQTDEALAAPEPALTPRETDILRLIAQGLSNQEIAERLNLAEQTVRVHVSHLLAALHLSNRTQAALYALRQGLASLEPPG